MRVLVLGATGGIGRRVVPRLLAAGHEITTLSRRPGAVEAGPAIRPLVGDVTDPGAVRDAVEGQDAVISALGVTSLEADDTLTVGTKTLVAAMDEAGVRRLLAVTGNGLGINAGPIVDLVLTPDAAAPREGGRAGSGGRDHRQRARLDDRPPVPAGRPVATLDDGSRVAPAFLRTLVLRWTTRDDVARCVVEHLDRGAEGVLWVASGVAEPASATRHARASVVTHLVVPDRSRGQPPVTSAR